MTHPSWYMNAPPRQHNYLCVVFKDNLNKYLPNNFFCLAYKVNIYLNDNITYV